jgi:hypothetical protein
MIKRPTDWKLLHEGGRRTEHITLEAAKEAATAARRDRGTDNFTITGPAGERIDGMPDEEGIGGGRITNRGHRRLIWKERLRRMQA